MPQDPLNIVAPGTRLDSLFSAEGGVLGVDKPTRWSSFDVIRKIRSRSGIKKIGHAGTLDPLATGVLVLCFGKSTQWAQQLTDADKSYRAWIRLGETTASHDGEWPVEHTFPTGHITRELILETLKGFSGKQMQIPPAFSAVKVDGKRAYKVARQGKDPGLKPREVTLHELELISWDPPVLELDISCSKGTYIRTLASDLGKAMNSGAWLSGLSRTASGPLTLENSWPWELFLEALEQHWNQKG